MQGGGRRMNLIAALECLKTPVGDDARPLKVFFGPRFYPSSVRTFLAAYLRNHPAYQVDVKSGLFGDLIGNVERLQPEEHDALAVVIE